jgi:flavin reductase (DIM6/NTAB) family NADH-FMN oxidoreductase RutF
MHFKIDEIPPHSTYNLINGLIFPRPIALVLTRDLKGRLNAAPFSAYNYLSTDPPVVGLGIASQPGKENVAKRTARNILNTREFVVNVVTEHIVEKMNICAIDFPPEIDKLEKAGFETEESLTISVPRIKGIHAALECKHLTTMQVGRSHIVLGQVLSIFVEDRYVDPKGPYIKSEEIKNVGRANGLGNYIKTSDSFFQVPRLTYEEWKKLNPG